jgi:DNA-binding SARP family transcriptional activator
MELRVLGPISAERNGQIVRLPGGRALTMLAVLAVEHGHPVSRERLIDVAWESRSPATAATQLQGFVSSLRRALPAGSIETHGTSYLLRLDGLALDLAVFEASMDRAGFAERSGDRAQAAALYRTALDVWHGAAFEGLGSTYLTIQASRLQNLRLLAVEAWARAELELDHPGMVIAELAPWIEIDPLRESLTGLMMLALYRTGRQADALATFRKAGRALRETLGVEPSRQLQELHRRILNADPALTPDVDSLHAAALDSPGPRRGPRMPLAQLPPDVADFTGREAMVKHLIDVVSPAHTAASTAAVCLVTGTGGVGKPATAF